MIPTIISLSISMRGRKSRDQASADPYSRPDVRSCDSCSVNWIETHVDVSREDMANFVDCPRLVFSPSNGKAAKYSI
jgi:hypothetical protein